MRGEGALGVASNAGQNLVGGLGPNEGCGIFVVDLDKLADRRFQILHAAKHTTSNPFVGEFGEPALNQVDPRTVGRREVNVEPWALGKPVPDDGCFVSRVVVDNEMDI